MPLFKINIEGSNQKGSKCFSPGSHGDPHGHHVALSFFALSMVTTSLGFFFAIRQYRVILEAKKYDMGTFRIVTDKGYGV